MVPTPHLNSDENFFKYFIYLVEQIFQSEKEFNLTASGKPVSVVAVSLSSSVYHSVTLMFATKETGAYSGFHVNKQPLCTSIRKYGGWVDIGDSRGRPRAAGGG